MTDAGLEQPDQTDPSTSAERPRRSKQTMKPMTAAKKLGVYLPATPASFREAEAVTRAELARLINDPPAWLVDLRRDGPHPRDVVAARLGVSIAGLVRGGAGEALSTSEIDTLRQDPPEWLVQERASLARVRAEEERASREASRRASGSAASR